MVFKQENYILKGSPSVTFRYRYTENNYDVTEYIRYEKGVITYRSILVYDKEEMICNQSFKTENGILVPDYSKTIKHFYNESYEKYHFLYNPDGTCHFVDDHVLGSPDIHGADIGNPEHTKFTCDEFEYYRFAWPAIPEGKIWTEVNQDIDFYW